MEIKSKKEYEIGEEVICIISSSTNLETGNKYIISQKKYNRYSLKEEDGYGYYYNPARFISKREIRDSKIKKILED